MPQNRHFEAAPCGKEEAAAHPDWTASARVIHCKRERYDIYIGRPSKWGNPYVIGRDGSSEQVIARYRAWMLGRPDLLAGLPELRGQVLGCWCAPQPCHGDVLVELLSSLEGA